MITLNGVIKMPRQARKKSDSGIYHIMLRGINRQRIFEDEEDCVRFLETLQKYKFQCGFELYAYCLMGNHIHLLMKEGKEDLTQIFKRIAGSYVYWYNWKYHRCGHLFQDRFRSEPVETDEYFLTVLRYIHRNPVKAMLCQLAEEYSYSSMREYLSGTELTDTGFALSMISKEQFVDFHREENTDQCLDISENDRMTDEEARMLMQNISKCDNIIDFQLLDKQMRSLYIRKLHEKGASIRQIGRITGVSKKVIEQSILK